MKKFANIINIIILMIIAALGIAMIIVGVKTSSIADDGNVIMWISTIFMLVMVVVFCITGIFLPAEDTYVTKKQSIVLGIILALNALQNRTLVYKGQVDVATGDRPFRRGWEPTIGLIWMILQVLLSIFVIGLNPGSQIAMLSITSLVMIMLFIVFSFIWRIEDNKERYGDMNLKKTLLPSLIALIIFAFGMGVGVIKTNLEYQDDFNFSEIKQDVQDAKEHADSVIADSQLSESDALSMEDISSLIHESMENDGDIYYKKQESADSDSVIFIVWTDDSDDVCWYKFATTDNGYAYEASMKSDSLVKSDVVGKEDGIL